MNPSELLNKEFKVPGDSKLRRWPETPVIVPERKKNAKKRRKPASKNL